MFVHRVWLSRRLSKQVAGADSRYRTSKAFLSAFHHGSNLLQLYAPFSTTYTTHSSFHTGMAAPEVISRSQLLPSAKAQQACANGTVDAVQRSPAAEDIVISSQRPSMLASHGRSSAVVVAEPSSTQSQRSVSCAPASAAPSAGTQRPQSTAKHLPVMEFVPSGKIESADFALYAQMHLHNPQFHQQQWERNDISPPHPVIESFPSFRTPRATEELTSEADESAEASPDSSVQHQQGQRAQANAPTLLQAPEASNSSNAQHTSPKGNNNAPSLSSSHSSMASPTRQQQLASLTATPRRSVSLLSQQLATARSAAAVAAAEYEAGTSGRHRSEFWQYLQVRDYSDAVGTCCAAMHSRPGQQQQAFATAVHHPFALAGELACASTAGSSCPGITVC